MRTKKPRHFCGTCGLAIDYDPFSLAPRLDPLKSILAKLDPVTPRPEPLPSVKVGVGPSRGQRRRRWRG